MKLRNKVRAIAFYLPQFYPTKENDEWWSPGFTEWTNVAMSKPLFKGHYQPRIPQKLGFYDLRVPSVREQQADLAQEAGIEGFCYWHYGFAGRRLLDQVFREVVESGKPDFPFCLCWANHSWKAKTWQADAPDRMLIEQTYPGVSDYTEHFYAMLPAFKDSRYMKVNGKLIFGIFDAPSFDDNELFIATWNRLAKENGLEGFYFFALLQQEYKSSQFNHYVFDAVVYDPIQDAYNTTVYRKYYRRWHEYKVNKLLRPVPVKYDKYVEYALQQFKKYPEYIPSIEPDFDHSPRSGHRWVILHESTPDKWADLCKRTMDICNRDGEENLLFIKAWNEWGEGNYLEPDMKWGKRYIEATGSVLKQ